MHRDVLRRSRGVGHGGTRERARGSFGVLLAHTLQPVPDLIAPFTFLEPTRGSLGAVCLDLGCMFVAPFTFLEKGGLSIYEALNLRRYGLRELSI